MLIAQISDSHIDVPAKPDTNRADDLQRCVDDINALDTQPGMVIHTGDIAHDGKQEEYIEARRILDQLAAPWYPMPGNKDDRDVLRDVLGDRLPSTCHEQFIQYWLDAGPRRAVMLDSANSPKRKAWICPQRLEHLDAMLDECADHEVILFMHHPPFAVLNAPDPFQFENDDNLTKLAGILARYPNISQICCGHIHRPGSGQFAGIDGSVLTCIASDIRYGPTRDTDPLVRMVTG